MKFDTPAGQNPIDRMRVVGQPLDRIDGKYKVTGTAHYAYEWHDVTERAAYGHVIGAGIAKPVVDQAEGRQCPIQHRHRQHDAVRQGRETEHDGEELLHRLPSWAVGGGRPFGARRARPVDPRASPHGRRAWDHPM